MKGSRISYSAEELAWLEDNRTMVISEYHAAFCRQFGRSDVSAQNLNALRKRRGWKTGRTGQFPKGHEPANKGMKGFHAPGSEKGWFKKGQRRGAAKKLYKPIGTERVTKDGYLERKIHDGLPLQARWRAVHLINWEALNGPVPDGHALKCLDGDRQNTDPENWIAVPRSMLPDLNGRWTGVGYDESEPELKPSIMASAKLKQRVRDLRDEKK